MMNTVSCMKLQKLREEQAARLVFEKSLREEMERRWQSLKAYIDEEAQSGRQSEKVIILKYQPFLKSCAKH